jgi:predicted oxidoreductase
VVDGAEWVVAHIRPGLAKNFGGVLTDSSSRVLAPDGTPIPGIWAAGECVGMIPGGGAGAGFSGSASALYHGGRLAGAGAAARSLSAP